MIVSLEISYQKLTVDQFPITIGRSTNNTVVIDDQWVSRNHCTLYVVDDKLMLRDNNSKHGVRLNYNKIIDCQVHSGDVINIGLTHILITIVT